MRTCRFLVFGLALVFVAAGSRAEDAPAGQALTGHTSAVWAVSFAPDGKTLASSSFDKSVRLWDLGTNKQTALLQHPAEVPCVAISPKGKVLASGDLGGNVYLWDLASGNKIATLKGHKSRVRSVAFSPSGKRLVSGSWDETAIVWNVATHKRSKTVNPAKRDSGPPGGPRAMPTGDDGTGPINSVAVSADGKTGAVISAGGGGNVVYIFTMATGKVTAALKPAGYLGAFSSDGKTLVAGNYIWDWKAKKNLRQLKAPDTHRIQAVAFSPDGRTIATGGSDKTVRLWNARTGEEKSVLTGHAQDVMAVTFSADGTRIASGDSAGTIRVWGVEKK